MSSREIDFKWVTARNGAYQWKQARSEVFLRFKVTEDVRGRDIKVETSLTRMTIKLRGADIIFGPLFSSINADETLWTLEDQWVEIVLVKTKQHESWKGVFADETEHVDPITLEDMQKKMMLEKFQADHPTFDFTGAEFSGQVPKDPANFARFD